MLRIRIYLLLQLINMYEYNITTISQYHIQWAASLSTFVRRKVGLVDKEAAYMTLI